MNRQETMKRVAKIGALYGFALLSAIACGEGFKPLNLNQKLGTGTGAVTPMGNSSVTINKVSVYPLVPDTGFGFVLQDGGTTTSEIMVILQGTNEGTATETVNGIQYTVKASCTEPTLCQYVVALASRANSPAQLAFLLEGQGSVYRTVYSMPGNFTSTRDIADELFVRYQGQ